MERRKKDSERGLHYAAYNDFDKNSKTTQWAKDCLSLKQMVLEKLDIHMKKKGSWILILHHIIKLTQNV